MSKHHDDGCSIPVPPSRETELERGSVDRECPMATGVDKQVILAHEEEGRARLGDDLGDGIVSVQGEL